MRCEGGLCWRFLHISVSLDCTPFLHPTRWENPRLLVRASESEATQTDQALQSDSLKSTLSFCNSARGQTAYNSAFVKEEHDSRGDCLRNNKKPSKEPCNSLGIELFAISASHWHTCKKDFNDRSFNRTSCACAPQKVKSITVSAWHAMEHNVTSFEKKTRPSLTSNWKNGSQILNSSSHSQFLAKALF